MTGKDAFCCIGAVDHKYGYISQLNLEHITVLMGPFTVLLRSIGFDVIDVADER